MEFNGNLIITNTPNNHRSINSLLTQLRRIRALQINVESRFLTVSNNWFEQIGVDLDLYFNTNSSLFQQLRGVDPTAHVSDFFDDDGRLLDPLVFGDIFDPTGLPLPGAIVPWGSIFGLPSTAALVNNPNIQGITYITGPVGSPIRNTDGVGPIAVTQNSLNNIADLAELSGFGALAAASPALATGLQFLDDIQVDLLIEATQADKRSVVMTAPRLTFFNGQRSWIAVNTQTSFISGLQVVAGDAAAAFIPQLNVLNDGFVLDVEGVISSDRRYVTMTVIFDFAQFEGFRESAATEFGGAAGGGGSVGGSSANFSAGIELPILVGSRIRTTVSVPDKGTILLGGQRQITEIEVEEGVPILSKIPFINRFFTNRLTSKDEKTLLILIRPEIIIQQENEDLLFPGLSDDIGAFFKW